MSQERNTFAKPAKDDKQTTEKTMETKVATSLIDMHAKKGPEVFENRITDECLSIFNTNSTIRKCSKSKTKDVMKFVEIHPMEYIL